LILANDPAATFAIEAVAADCHGAALRQGLKHALQSVGALPKVGQHEAKFFLGRPGIHHARLEEVRLPQEAIEVHRCPPGP
jgi:hypothetical protein